MTIMSGPMLDNGSILTALCCLMIHAKRHPPVTKTLPCRNSSGFGSALQAAAAAAEEPVVPVASPNWEDYEDDDPTQHPGWSPYPLGAQDAPAWAAADASASGGSRGAAYTYPPGPWHRAHDGIAGDGGRVRNACSANRCLASRGRQRHDASTVFPLETALSMLELHAGKLNEQHRVPLLVRVCSLACAGCPAAD
jgi:hypothetical protein